MLILSILIAIVAIVTAYQVDILKTRIGTAIVTTAIVAMIASSMPALAFLFTSIGGLVVLVGLASIVTEFYFSLFNLPATTGRVAIRYKSVAVGVAWGLAAA